MNSTAQSVSIRAALFLGITALSIPLVFALGMAVLVPLQGLLSPWPEGELWHWIDDYVFDMPLKWPYLILAPGIPAAVVFWTVVAFAYGWLTRRVRVLYAGLGVLPTVWGVGVVLVTVIGA